MASELLSGFRMLDLTDERGALCGKIFADLGADVVKVEPPSGCPTRRIPPFLDDQPGPDRGLYFIAYQAGKRSVTLNLESADGRALLEDLARKSDFLVESFAPGYMDSLGLGYERLAELNPRLIYASITPFGDSGPARNYKAADIVSWASGGPMFMMGEKGRPPLEMSVPQAGLHAGAEAAVASLLAHYPREIEGRGQRVIVNTQACVVWTLMNEQAMPIMHGDYIRRDGVYYSATGSRRQLVYACKDGYISTLLAGGPGVGAISMKGLVGWMAEKGCAAQWMIDKDWASWVPGILMKATEKDLEEIADLEDRVRRFFATMTKREIYAEGLKRRILLAPVATAADIAEDEQLKARNYFVRIEHDTLGRTLTLPGAFAKMSVTPIGPARRAPRLGEHNGEVWGELMGIDGGRMSRLRAIGAI
ncbi:MAG TPA: CoA transferase [Candidatus Binataceae bacterium]|jgi:crotonobetainyl-CoA:carnitine CoA-transferase CaiB-like acyl-CoA transferase|nr:CoA transferase [Candidatus Binataceae bacterium]